MSRVKAVVLLVGGLVVFVLGLGMWKSPEMSWEGFLNAWSLLGEELARLKDDPFAILGILVIVVGAFITYHAVRKLVKG